MVALLALLMLGAAIHTTAVIREQQTLGVLLHASGKLQLTVQAMEKQSLNYLENAPRDYPTYYRDVKLYYEDLKGHIATFDMFTDAFMTRSFSPEMTGMSGMVHPPLNDATMHVVHRVEKGWTDYRQQLMKKLGEDSDEPRLEWAAEFIAANSGELEKAADELAMRVRHQVDSRAQRINLVNTILLICYVLVSLLVVLWFFRRVIRRLSSTAEAFQRVTKGDFGYRIPLDGRDEISSLTDSFNQLSERIHALFELTTRIQRGSDLDQTLCFIAEDIPRLMPLDWLGILFENPNGQMRLERAYRDGVASTAPRQGFDGNKGLLRTALDAGGPVHVPPGDGTTADDEFGQWLAGQGLRDAILLPVREHTPQAALLVFASRQPASYSTDHMELMRNIGLLVSLSFARTVLLSERARLAAIGEFTSGIVHELRTPLATVGLALEYLRSADLPSSAARRTELASSEVERMGRLLSNVLQYARPLVLQLEPLDLSVLVRDTLDTHRALIGPDQRLQFNLSDAPLHVSGDRDRLTQVILNLTRNAAEAAGAGGWIEWASTTGPDTVYLSIRNPGPVIQPDHLGRIFEPFFTTRAGGTGLGLSIVRRIIDAHGGEIRVSSTQSSGTLFSIALPASETTQPPSD